MLLLVVDVVVVDSVTVVAVFVVLDVVEVTVVDVTVVEVEAKAASKELVANGFDVSNYLPKVTHDRLFANGPQVKN